MKKIYLSALFFGMLASANAQENNAYTINDLQQNEVTSAASFAPKALGVEIWSNNFDTPADWVIDNDGQNGAAFGWTIDANSDGWWSANGITSTSGGNFAELSNGDPGATPASQAIGVTYTMTTAVPIDVVNLPLNASNTSDVTLQYQEYGARFNDLQEVQISTDGVTWTTVRNNLGYDVLSQSSPNAAYANPENISINLAPYIDNTTAQSLLIRFSWTTNFPSQAANANVWVTYGWYIDDVKLVTNPDNDIEVTSNYWGSDGLNYYMIPTTQVTAIDFSANVFNGGINDQNEVQLNISVDGGATFSGSSATGTIIASGATDSLFLATGYTPAANTGSHTITRTITATQTDDVPTNNVLEDITFEVTDFIYARDNNIPSGTRSNQGKAFESGNYFDIWSDIQVRAVDVILDNSTNVGTFIYAKIYSIDANGDFIEEGASDYHEVVAADLSGTVTLELYSWVNLTNTQLTYLVVVGSDGDGGATNDLVIKTAGTSDVQTSFFKDETDTWFYTTNTPMVRLNFNPTIGLDENTLEGVAIFPNPSEGIVTVSNDNNTTNSIEVFNLVGEKVYSTTASTSTKIDLSANGTGVYIVKVYNENGSFVERVVIK